MRFLKHDIGLIVFFEKFEKMDSFGFIVGEDGAFFVGGESFHGIVCAGVIDEPDIAIAHAIGFFDVSRTQDSFDNVTGFQIGGFF